MGCRIVDLRSRASEEWLPHILSEYPYKPLWWIPGVSPESQKALMEHAMRTALADKHRSVLACESDGELVGFAQMRRMEWDSAHFGFTVYRLDDFAAWGSTDQATQSTKLLAQAVVDRATCAAADSIHTWMPLEAIRCIQGLEGVGFRIMDVQTTWVFEHAKERISDYRDRCLIRGYEHSDEEALVALARVAYMETPSRFYSDRHLPVERSNELYAEWTRNSCSGKLADHVVVAELDGKPVGYTTLKLDGDYEGLSNIRTGCMVLSAVAPWARGSGVYTSMINNGLKWLAERKVDVSHLGTQANNYPVQRAWARLGFRPARSGPSMHLWLGE